MEASHYVQTLRWQSSDRGSSMLAHTFEQPCVCHTFEQPCFLCSQAQSIPSAVSYNHGHVFWGLAAGVGDSQDAKSSACGLCGQRAEPPRRMPSRTPSPVPRQELKEFSIAPGCACNTVSSLPESKQSFRIGGSSMSTPEEGHSTQVEQKMMELSSTRPYSPMMIKNTFLHYGGDDEALEQQARLKRSKSAPGAIDRQAGSKHDSKKCKPCAYFFGKPDGCREGDDCRFCHLCPPGKLKEKKKEKKRRLKTNSRK